MSINTVIEHVTVYREGALVRRTGSSPGNGDNPSKGEIAICGLPLSMDDYSVRAGISDGVIRDVRVILEVPKPDPDLKVSENIELKKTRRSVQRLHRELSELDESIERTRNITWPERPTPKDPDDVIASPLEDRSSFAEYIKDRYTGLMDRRKNLMTSLKEASETLQLLEDREKGATSAKQNRMNELRKTVILSIDKDRQPKGRVKFYVEYLIPGAKWAAAYSLRFNSDFSDSILESKAMVSQNSGEDWKGVNLTLSTALPHRWYDLPELRARKIGRAVSAKPKSGWKEPPVGAEKLYSDFDSFIGARVSISSSKAISPEMEYEMEDVYEEEFPEELMKSSFAGEMSEEPPEMASPKKKRMADMGAPMKPMKKAASLRKEPSVSDVMLDYDSLRLGDMESGPRTGLKVLSKRERYSELLSDAAGNGDENLMNSIDRMESLSLEVSRSDPPDGCVFPSSVDGYDYAFNADTPVSIDSDGRYHSVPLQSRRMISSMKYIAVPRIDSSVYGTAELKNEGTAPLMPGPVDIRVASDFLCTGSFDLVPPAVSLSWDWA
jgi:hypothetical protein